MAGQPTDTKSDIGDPPTTPCVACREPIRVGARTCPHCRSAQRPEKIKLFASTLKWIGGITAVISLVIGSASVYKLYESWVERRTAVAELVAAARIQLASRDYEGGWSLLDQALDLEPASRAARAFQVPFAMEWLRHVRVPAGQSFADVVDPLLRVLYRGVSNERSAAAADVYAHIGWANYLKRRSGNRLVEVDPHFEKALELDPSNVYANAFSAHWMLNPLNDIEKNAATVAEARRRIEQALATGTDTGYVVELAFAALLGVSDGAAVRATLDLANELRKRGTPVPRGALMQIGRFYQPLVSFDRRFAEAKLAELSNRLAVVQLREFYDWMVDQLALSRFLPETQQRFISARLAEAAGDREAALAIYRALAGDASVGSDFRDAVLAPAIARAGAAAQ